MLTILLKDQTLVYSQLSIIQSTLVITIEVIQISTSKKFYIMEWVILQANNYSFLTPMIFCIWRNLLMNIIRANRFQSILRL